MSFGLLCAIMRSQVNLGARLDFVSIHQDVSICPQEIPAQLFSVRSSSGVIITLSLIDVKQELLGVFRQRTYKLHRQLKKKFFFLKRLNITSKYPASDLSNGMLLMNALFKTVLHENTL